MTRFLAAGPSCRPSHRVRAGRCEAAIAQSRRDPVHSTAVLFIHQLASCASACPPSHKGSLCPCPLAAADSYLVNKTSSSIATAINVGTPLLAEER